MTASTQPPWRKTINGINITFVKEEGSGHETVPSSIYIGAAQARHWDESQLRQLLVCINQALGLLLISQEVQNGSISQPID